MDRVPAWAKYARQNTQNLLYEAVFWNPPEPYEWKSKRPSALKSLRIYEAHVGMSSEEGRVASYKEFADNVIPRIKDGGYNCI